MLREVIIIWLYILRILCGMSRDKDIRECLKLLMTGARADRIHFAQV